MLSPHLSAALVRERHQMFLEEANTQRLARDLTAPTPRHREWVARQLVILALRIAPSLRRSGGGALLERV